MNRLTMMDSQGNWRLKGVEWRQLQEGEIITRHMAEKLYGALYKLKAYEDTGLMPEQIVEMDGLYTEKCKELAERSKGWIPCSERLPEKNEYIKVWLSFTNNICSFVKRAIWYGSHFEYENGKVVSDTPTAWMQYYAPEPYQQKGE